MALNLDEHPSRWKLYVEVRDCVHGILAPRLPLPHLMENGARIAAKARVRRPKRPLQGVGFHRLASRLG